MKIGHFLRSISFVIPAAFTVLLFNGSAFPQETREPHIKGVMNTEGWEIRGVKDSRTIVRLPLNNGEGSPPIYSSLLEPKGGSVVLENTAFYGLQADGTLVFRPMPMVAYTITSYEVKGKVFCYIYKGVCALIQKKKDTTFYIPTGCVVSFAFYDEDGDGTFERQEMPQPDFKLRLPDWAK